VSDILCHIGVSCTVIILVVLLPWYAVGSHYYGTYENEYAWTVSAAFMSGLAPGLVDLFLYFFMASFVAASAVYLVVRTDRARQRTSSRLSSRSSSSSAVMAESTVVAVAAPLHRRVALYTWFMAVNLFAVVGMNVAFLAVALTQDNTLLLIAQVVLSSFKLLWNTVCTPYLIRATLRGISWSHHSTGFMTMQVLIALFNNITVPCLVVAVVSPSCFYNVFKPAPSVTLSFVYQIALITRTGTDRQDFAALTNTISYEPPFEYDYQCSSSFITYYSPAFVYLAIAAGVVTPLVHMLSLHWYKRATPGTRWSKLLTWMLPTVLTPIRAGYPPSQVFDANIHVISLVTYLGILLTFGVVYPPLAVAMCATMVSVAWQARLEIGRFIHRAREAGELRHIDTLERNCQGAVSLKKLRRSLFIVVCFSCAFYALFVFDTLGNSVGLTSALWSLVVMPLFPLVIVTVVTLRAYVPYRRSGGGGADGASVGFSVDENVFEMHKASVGSVSSARGGSVKEGEQRQGETAASAQGQTVFNALQLPAPGAEDDPL
jgi:hypothetical protein